MTETRVVDASVLAALLLGKPEAGGMAAQLADMRLVAPALLGFELANVCAIKARRQPAQAAALVAALRLRDRLGVREIAVDHDDVVELAVATGLTAYDASYLWVARRLGAELVTLDRQLAKAAAVRS